MRIGIIGAGISGLTLAYELQKRGVDYHLWEASAEPGGYIRSRRELVGNASYLRELGPNSLLGGDELLAWIDELGLTSELLFANPVSKARFVYRNGHYRALPSGPPSLLGGTFFSWRTKWAIVRELFNKTRSIGSETLGHFFRRRFSDELVDYALAPFVSGIYAGDPDQLLVSETFPMLLAYERDYGSVLKGLIKNQSAAGRRQSFSFRDGMQTLPDALAARLTKLSLNDPVSQLTRTSNGWRVTSVQGITEVDQLVLAVGADAAARLVAPYYDGLAQALQAVRYPPMTAVHSAYKRVDVQHPLNGFGGLNPAVEKRFAAGHIWSSSVFGTGPESGRCPADEVLFTSFVGGMTAADNARQPDEVIFRNIHQELARSFGIRASEPVFRAIYRWDRAIPQYDGQIVAVQQQVAAVKADKLLVCANWYGGLSLADCLKKARNLAEEIGAKSLINNF
ncbi:protoporphyrinogen oxidase [Spirosoma sordidisoli]|uniref:Coproporphyrinogen III oxidase n=1 Tax=Spirosoma sordidisoli TaxID=2502893 RepID=A0A4Q2UM95_9BACT|nr:protoporphyrinogen oxidase [Spirosoma sordidisoli]RYC68670.1 protoporphyrinogen oxidase [Spirosoma sordidisoli]